MRYEGKIVRWNDEKGFGFVLPKMGGQPVFVHVRGFSDRERRPFDEALVSYELGSDVKGRCCAVNVVFADEGKVVRELRVSVLPILLSIAFLIFMGGLVWSGRVPIVIAVGYLMFSLIAFGAYALDKDAAENRRWRMPEKKLFILGLAGGWPGAVLAQQLLRHKSSKREFQVVFWFTVVLNCGALFWLLSPDGASVRALLDGVI